MSLMKKLTYPYRYLTLRRHYSKDVAQRKAKAGRGVPKRKK